MAWTIYKEVEYAADAIPTGDLSGFPVPVWITADADIADELSGGGGVKFTSADGLTDLPFGLYPSSNLAAGTVHARVKIDPDADASVGTVAMRLYYSAAESTTEDKAGTVDNDYIVFMPMEEDPSGSAPQMLDWVSETNVGTSAGTMTSGDLVAAEVGSGLDFDGTDDYIQLDLSAHDGDAEGTFEVILARSDASTPAGVGQTGLATTGKQGDNTHYPWTDGSLYLSFFGVTTRPINGFADSGFDKTVRHGIAISSASGAGNYKFFRNGSLVTTGTGESTVGYGAAAKLGTSNAGTYHFPGTMDEVRLSSVARSADWLAYSHTTDFNKADLWTLGAEQGGGGATATPWYHNLQMAG